MSLPLLISSLAVLSFGCTAIYYFFREQKTRRKLEILERENKNRAFEEKLLEEIHGTLDASLDVKKVVSVLSNHLPKLFDCTTVSSLIATDKKLTITNHVIKPVPHSYIDDVKETMLASLETLEKQSFHDAIITQETTGTLTDSPEKQPLSSITHLPLMIHHSVLAIITITSTEPHAFAHESIASIQHILRQTTKSLSRLDNILQVEKGKLTAMIESMPDGIFMLDMKNNLQIINPAAKQFLGLHKEHITTMDVLSALPVSYDFKGKIALAMQRNQGIDVADIVLKNKLLSFSVRPVRATTGDLLGISVLMRDNTLKHAVPRMKEDFTNIIVHELRNPLTSIKASSELLISPMEFSKEEQTKLIHLIYQQSNKLLTDVQQILDAAKLEAGVFTTHKHQADLKQIIKDITTSFQSEAQQKMINLLVDVDSRLPSFSFDSKEISQALTNVLSNSMKFTATGGTIQVIAKQKHSNVVITVADTGAGIPKDKQHLIFNKFSQLSEGSAIVGKGLGLYVAKGIIEAHGGKVELDSDTGRGTTIFMSLPLSDPTYHQVSHPLNTSTLQKMVN